MTMPTNATLAKQIEQNHAEIKDRLEGVEKQVLLTNGRVKDLERKDIAREAVLEYKAKEKVDRKDNRAYTLSILLTIATLLGIGIGVYLSR